MDLSPLLDIWSGALSWPFDLVNCTREVSEGLKVLILILGIALILLRTRIPSSAFSRLLVILAVFATLNYGRWGGELFFYKVDNYDLVHYYLNPKYFNELGYYDLYPAAIVADRDNGGPKFKEGGIYMSQDERGHEMRPIQHADERGRWVRDNKFSPERWKQFEHDLLHLQRNIPGFSDILWKQMIRDHGYNGTPAWTAIAQPLAQAVPVEYVKFLGYLDLLLLLIAAGATWWAFGWKTAAILWFFLMTCYSMRWPTVTWSFLRCDYLAALIVAMALIKKGHYLAGGLLSGYSAAVRIFPLLWLYGGACKFFYQLTQKKLYKPSLLLLAGAGLGFAALLEVVDQTVGIDQVRIHFDNMVDHTASERLSSRRIGMAMALPYYPGQQVPTNIEEERKQLVEKQKPLRYGIAILILVAMGWGLRNAKDEEAFAFGFIPFFLLTTASYYYYAARATLIIMHASDLNKTRNLFGLVFLLGLELLTNFSEVVFPGHRVFLIGNLSWGLLIYALTMTVWISLENYRNAKAPSVSEARDRPDSDLVDELRPASHTLQ